MKTQEKFNNPPIPNIANVFHDVTLPGGTQDLT